MILQCKACNGVYPTKQLDGSLYFHSCPPSVSPAQARNENVPDSSSASNGKRIADGAGTQAPAVVPPGMQGLVGLN